MDWSVANDVSDKGEIVGSSGRNGSPLGRAFIWSGRDGMRDLGALIASESAATGALSVNWSGNVVGFSWNGSSYRPVIFPAVR
jgi:probable HAF family extracellular repeat protein